MYWYRTPYEKSVDGWVFHERVIARYVNLLNSNSAKPIVVVTDDPVDVAYLYLFYSQKYLTVADILSANTNLKQEPYHLNGITFQSICPEVGGRGTYLFQKPCAGYDNFDRVIANPRDAGGWVYIVNDQLCQLVPANRYPRPEKITDFVVEKMSKIEFCQKWLTDPR